MGEEERLNLERQIRDTQRDLQREENEYLEDLNARRNEEVGKLQREVLQRVQAYASAQKYDLVLADAIYVSGAVDITQSVITALQAAAPVASPAAPAAAKKP
jgi:outer membrane protein